MPSPPLLSLSGVAGLMELVGGALLIVGLLSRPVAFLLSGQMAVAYFIAHASKGSPLFPLANGGDAAVLYCFVFLHIFCAGLYFQFEKTRLGQFDWRCLRAGPELWHVRIARVAPGMPRGDTSGGGGGCTCSGAG